MKYRQFVESFTESSLIIELIINKRFLNDSQQQLFAVKTFYATYFWLTFNVHLYIAFTVYCVTFSAYKVLHSTF